MAKRGDIVGGKISPRLRLYDNHTNRRAHLFLQRPSSAGSLSGRWRQDDPGALDLTLNRLAPADPAEAATILFLPVGAYTLGANGGTGIGLIEVYNLESQ